MLPIAHLPRLLPARRLLRAGMAGLLTSLLLGCAALTGGPVADPATPAVVDDAPVLAAFSSQGFYPALLAPNLIRLDLPSNDSFASGSAEVPAAMQRALDRVAKQFNSPVLQGWEMLVVGHADDRGSDADNLLMSQARASNALAYLVAQGSDTSRLRSEGRGEREPLATNDQRYGRALNRRVELFLHRGPLAEGATAPR